MPETVRYTDVDLELVLESMMDLEARVEKARLNSNIECMGISLGFQESNFTARVV